MIATHVTTEPMDLVFAAITSRLRAHFETVRFREPLGAGERASRFGGLPELPHDLRSFYALCDGIEVAVEGTNDVQGDVFDLRRIGLSYPLCGTPSCARLIPIRADGCGDYDCVVAGSGPCEGAVVFWDHEVSDRPAYLLGGTLRSYLTMWADNLIHTYERDGKRRPETIAPRLTTWPWVGKPEVQHPWPFDEDWLRAVDPGVEAILRDPAQRWWLARREEP